jgi:hypothetical protein
VVVAILAVVAGMVVTMTNGLDSRTRYDDTAKRLAEIRSAIIGPDAVSADGQLLSGGFLQDMGRLPTSDAELVVQGSLPSLSYDTTWRTWYGWRGPYLAAPPKRSGDAGPRLYDGWGNDFQGWALQDPVTNRSYAVWSFGADGKAGGAGFDADYPDNSAQPLIAAPEWESPELSGRLEVTVVNLTAQDFSGRNVRLRLVVPDFSRADGPLGCTYASDACVSASFLLNVRPVPTASDPPAQNRQTWTFVSNQASLKVPLGRRAIFLLNADGSPLGNVDACAELSLSKRLSPYAVTLYVRPRS